MSPHHMDLPNERQVERVFPHVFTRRNHIQVYCDDARYEGTCPVSALYVKVGCVAA